VHVGQSSVTVAGIHVLPETSAFSADTDTTILAGLKKFAGDNASRLILVGDFNATPFSALFHQLLHSGHFVDSERGFGLQPSWPYLGVGMLMIPLDHCLTTPDCSVVSRSTGDFIGSDHLPLFLRIAIAD
jgi:endonuclease/exonuclease/phosphatase (EEP) superfamily protein YafD